MKKMKQILICIMLAVSASALMAGYKELSPEMQKFMERFSKQDQENVKELTTVLAINATINSFRDNNVKSPEKDHLQFFGSLTGIKWKNMQKKSDFTPIFWSDFFTGTTLINGPYNEKNAIVALYNVWWDAILFFRLDAVPNSPQWKISSFELKSGEFFRGEKTGEIPSIDSVIAQKGQQALVWMQLIKKTRNCFNSYFTTSDPANYKFSNSFEANSKLPVQLRAAARMKLHQVMLKNKGVIVEMSAFLQLLRGIKAEKMKDVLKGDDLETFAYFASMPIGFRRTMTYYGYWGTERHRLYLYISKMNPNIICLLYINAGVRVNFEMFDLNDSEKYLDAIEKAQAEKAVAK